jgi:purine-nucleoside phosphorylase
MRVAGVSCITNTAAGMSNSPISHAEVLATTARAAVSFERLVTAFVQRLAGREHSDAEREAEL